MKLEISLETSVEDQDEIEEIFRKAMAGEPAEAPEQKVFTYDDILNTTFKLVLNPDIYQYNYYTNIPRCRHPDQGMSVEDREIQSLSSRIQSRYERHTI